MELEERATIISKGTWAKSVQDDPQWQEFFQEINEDLFLSWGATKTDAMDEREAIYMTGKGVVFLQNKLGAFVENMKVEMKKNEEDQHGR